MSYLAGAHVVTVILDDGVSHVRPFVTDGRDEGEPSEAGLIVQPEVDVGVDRPVVGVLAHNVEPNVNKKIQSNPIELKLPKD